MKKNLLIVFCIDIVCILLVCYLYFYMSLSEIKLSEYFLISGIILIVIALVGLMGGAPSSAGLGMRGDESTVDTDLIIQNNDMAELERNIKNKKPLVDWKFTILMFASSLPMFILYFVVPYFQ